MSAEQADIVALNYLGMRTAPPGTHSERALRSQARRCAARKTYFLAQWEARQLPALRFRGRKHLEQALSLGKGAVVALPHSGPYHRVPSELVLAGIPTLLLIDSPNYEREVAAYDAWARAYPGDHPDPMRYVDAQTPLATWKLCRGLQEGRALCLWLDGNTGLADTQKTTVEVTFCGRRLRVRKGAAFLSARVGAPIVPALPRETRTGEHVVEFLPPLARAEEESSEDYCQRAMQALYSWLEEQVHRDPACWEEWYHLHLWCEPEPATAGFTPPTDPIALLDTRLQSTGQQYVALALSQGAVLAHLQTGMVLAQTPLLVALLKTLAGGATVEATLDRLTPRFSETEILEALLGLSEAGFVQAAEEQTL